MEFLMRFRRRLYGSGDDITDFPGAMREDLKDAQAAVDWAIAQIPLMQQSLIDWQRRYPYDIVRKHDPKAARDVIVAIQRIPFPLTFNAWVGAIINSLRSSVVASIWSPPLLPSATAKILMQTRIFQFTGACMTSSIRRRGSKA